MNISTMKWPEARSIRQRSEGGLSLDPRDAGSIMARVEEALFEAGHDVVLDDLPRLIKELRARTAGA